MDEIARLLAEQSGVVSRRQVLANGGSPADLERALRRREWVRLLPGVFVDHTGRPTWLQRAWAGVLFYEPAALAGMSAVRAIAGPGWRRHPDHLPIEIAVEVARTVTPVAGYLPRRRARLTEDTLWNVGPPDSGSSRPRWTSPQPRRPRSTPSPCSPMSSSCAGPPPSG